MSNEMRCLRALEELVGKTAYQRYQEHELKTNLMNPLANSTKNHH